MGGGPGIGQADNHEARSDCTMDDGSPYRAPGIEAIHSDKSCL